ncbi:MAG: hypothetical protein ACK515_24810 [bacterium]|jgi:hypothetical protein
MDRLVMIELLVDDALLRATEGRGLSRLVDMLRNGFRGYAALSDEDLLDEIEIHGLASVAEDDGDQDLSEYDSEEIADMREFSVEDDRFG